jgi:hypothetical protein
MWTRFFDMDSGGGQKEQWKNIYIEAPEKEAVSVFHTRFGHDPNNVTCNCCGEDYSIAEYDTLEEATSFDRNDYIDNPKNPTKLEKYLTSKNVLCIFKDDISPWEKTIRK